MVDIDATGSNQQVATVEPADSQEHQEVAEDGVAANADNGSQPTGRESFMAIAKSLIIRAMIIYFITSFFRRPQQPPPAPNGSGVDVSSHSGPVPATNVFSDGMVMDLYVYVSHRERFTDFKDPTTLIWQKNDLMYGDWVSGPTGDGGYTQSISFPASEHVQNNGSLYMHIYLVKSGFSPDPSAGRGQHDRYRTAYISYRLNKFKRRTYRKTSNLITGKTQLTTEEIEKAKVGKEEIVSHWHPNVTINLVHDFTHWTRGSVPPPLNEFVEFNPLGDTYKPVLYINTYWNLNREYQPINETVATLNLTLTFQPLSLFKWQMYAAQSMKNRWPGMLDSFSGDEDENEQDSLKEMFLETSPYLLGLTITVSIVHSIFEFLAFKNDIQFWNNRQSLEGLSVRSVFFNVLQSVIVLLYVLDNETNFVIKVSCFITLAIELWKITKVMNVSINRDRRIFGVPLLKFTDKGTYVESKTKLYDEMAFRYLGIALFPLLGGYGVYSLLYQEHRGWYSFMLSILYGFLLTFGFIMMTPQLFINYKLKSVAHLPWRMLTYKALNTFIDDIFAFVIRMPTMYRIGCLRDDVVFFIFLYQRYIYRVDPTRMNEFGFSQEMEREAMEKKSQPIQNGEVTTDASISEPSKSVEDKKNE